MPIDQPLAMLINTNQLLGQLIRILYEKAKRARTQQVWLSLLFIHMITSALFRTMLKPMSCSRMRSTFSVLFIIKIWPLDNFSNIFTTIVCCSIWMKRHSDRHFSITTINCGTLVKASSWKTIQTTVGISIIQLTCECRYLDVNLELTRAALSYALSREKFALIQSLIPNARRIRPYFDLAKLLSRKYRVLATGHFWSNVR